MSLSFLVEAEAPAISASASALFVLLVAVAALVIALLARLIVRREPWEVEATPAHLRDLRRGYERALRALKDLEFDFQSGTLSQEEHQRLRAEYKRQAVRLRGALERARKAAVRSIGRSKAPALPAGEVEQVERLVAEARAGVGERRAS
jgi:hypothetical protein